MDIALNADGGRHTLALAGEFTLYAVAEAKERLLASLAETNELVVDVSAVSEIDTGGLQLLILLKREATAAGKPVTLTGHSQPVADLFALYGLADWLGGRA